MKHLRFRWAATTISREMVASSIIHGIRYDTVAELIGVPLCGCSPFPVDSRAPLIITLSFILILNGLFCL